MTFSVHCLIRGCCGFKLCFVAKGSTRRRRRRFQPKKFFRNLGQVFLNAIKGILRFGYRLGPAMCIFIAGAAALLIVVVILICKKPGENRQDAAIQPETSQIQPLIPEIISAPELPEEDDPEEGFRESEMPQEGPDYSSEEEAEPDIRLEKGNDGEDVLEIQQRLMKLGYLAIDEPTSHYGKATREAVRIFQRQHELDQDGIIGNQTYDLLMSDGAQKYVMKEGAEGKDIKDFQDKLYELGYLESNQITGYYGTDTVSAVMEFQKRNNLKQDGKTGELTLEAINSDEAVVSLSKEKEIEEERKAAEKAAAKVSAEGRINSMIMAAKAQLGKPYVLGSKGPDEYDCSGLAYYCLRKANVYCRRLDASGYSRTKSWKKITSLDDIKRGDLLFFVSEGSTSVGHVGIYVGSGDMIDASSANGKVVRRSCKTGFWKRNFYCARRPIS